MQSVTRDSFGLAIAFVLPGAIVIWGANRSLESPTALFFLNGQDLPTLGGFLYTTLAALCAGLAVNAVRWLLIDTLHHRTGIQQPRWQFRDLQRHFAAFEGLVENHYRHYQAYANCIVSIFAVAVSDISQGMLDAPLGILYAFLVVVFFAASRDALRKYYSRTDELLNSARRADRD